MNKYLPDDRQEVDHDPTAVADEIFELACEENNTTTPTEDMLEQAAEKLTRAWSEYENEGRYL